MKRKFVLFLSAVFVLCTLSLANADTSLAAAKKPKLNMKQLNLSLGGSFTLRVYNMNKKDKAAFASSDPSVVSVEASGSNTKRAVIRAKGIGSAKITVTIQRPKKKTVTRKCRVTVSPEAVSIKFAKRKLKIYIGQRIKADTIIKPSTSTELPVFESSNPSIVRVNPLGQVIGVSPGTTTITATTLSSNRSASCTVTVLPILKANQKDQKIKKKR